jgi:uncharacterized protein YjiS (DUF1127 family)
MTTTSATSHATISRHGSNGIFAQIAAAIAARMARAKARNQYRQMLAIEPHLLRDIGVTRSDVLAALRELDR